MPLRGTMSNDKWLQGAPGFLRAFAPSCKSFYRKARRHEALNSQGSSLCSFVSLCLRGGFSNALFTARAHPALDPHHPAPHQKRANRRQHRHRKAAARRSACPQHGQHAAQQGEAQLEQRHRPIAPTRNHQALVEMGTMGIDGHAASGSGLSGWRADCPAPPRERRHPWRQAEPKPGQQRPGQRIAVGSGLNGWRADCPAPPRERRHPWRQAEPKPWATEARTADCRRQRIKRMESGLPSPALGAPPSLAAGRAKALGNKGQDSGLPQAAD